MRLLVLLSGVLLLSGCTLFGWTKPEPEIVYEYIPYNIPKSLLNECELSKPISIEEYMKLTPVNREVELTNYVIVIYGDVKRCNNRMVELKKYIEKREGELK